MLHLILGRAGSGKSTKLTEYIAKDVEAGKRAWLIIPEQQANLSERTLLPKLPERAGLTFTITGFSRLAAEVASVYGTKAAFPPQKGLRALTMWRVLREGSTGDDAKNKLSVYTAASSRSDSRLTELLLSTVDELRACGIPPQLLKETADNPSTNTALRPKLNDLATLYAKYDESMSKLPGGNVDELQHLDELLRQHDNYFKGGHVYIDSFTDFTAAEFAVLAHMIRQADRVTLTLCCQGEKSGDPSMKSVEYTLGKLLVFCRDNDIEVKTEPLTENHRTDEDELRILERDLWNFSARGAGGEVEHKTGAITLLETSNVYAEVEAVALHILDLIHHGTRYGDVAVIFRNADTYRGVLEAAFERHGIPYYFSEKTPLTDKPLSRLLLSALRAVTHNWQSQDILTILKTGLCPVTSDEIDRFEQYVTTWNINSAGFATPGDWVRKADGYTTKEDSARGEAILAAANRVRNAIMPPLLRLHSRISKGAKLPELCSALYSFMKELSISERCAELASYELENGYVKEAGETVRVFDTVCTTLAQISAYQTDLFLDTEEFTTVLRMIFSTTEIASVPSLHDSVTVGSADTLRVENIEVAFVLGLCEGEFPAAVKDSGLLSAAEKAQLCSMGLPLQGLQETQSANELLYLWRAMTKPSRRLFASTVTADTQGKKKEPSLGYNRLLVLFPYLKKQKFRFDFAMTTPTDVHELTHAELDYDSYDEEKGEYEEGSTATSYTPIPATAYDPDPSVMARYFNDTLYLSQSRIEHFVRCPYRFYCTDLLGLREKKPVSINAANSGTFVHFVFEKMLAKGFDDDGNFNMDRLPKPEQLEAHASEIVNEYIRDLGSVTLSDMRTLHIFRRLKALTMMLLRDVVDELANSKFRPTSLEHKIGGKDAKTPYYEITLTGGRRILINGYVDRVDCYKAENGEIFIRVVDYKTGTKEFRLSDVQSGLNMQMLIYLFGLCRAGKERPAGVMYIATENTNTEPTPNRSGLLLTDAAVQKAADCRPKSKQNKIEDISGEDLAALEVSINNTLQAIGEDIFHGRAARTPSKDACRYCPMKASCPDAKRTQSF